MDKEKQKIELITQNSFYIDSHLHFQYFSNDELESIIKRCLNNEIPLRHFLTNSTYNKDFDRTIEIAKSLNMQFNLDNLVIPGIGYHPWYLEDIQDNWFDEMQLYTEKLTALNINFFIGEIGIDGGKIKKKIALDKQIPIFKKQLEFANKLNKLVTIHCVNEWEKLIKIILSSEISNLNSKIILHSFQGKKKDLNKLTNGNFWFSISPGCYFEKNFEVLRSIPLENMILESDSPSMFNKELYENEEEYSFYFRNENKEVKNHPFSILTLAKKISELRKISYVDFSSQLMKNYLKLIKNLF